MDASRIARQLAGTVSARASADRRDQRGDEHCNAGRPADAVEYLAKDEAADQAAGIVGGEVDPAGRCLVVLGGAADMAGGDRLCEEGADRDQRHAGEHDGEAGRKQRRKPGDRERQRQRYPALRAEARVRLGRPAAS